MEGKELGALDGIDDPDGELDGNEEPDGLPLGVADGKDDPDGSVDGMELGTLDGKEDPEGLELGVLEGRTDPAGLELGKEEPEEAELETATGETFTGAATGAMVTGDNTAKGISRGVPTGALSVGATAGSLAAASPTTSAPSVICLHSHEVPIAAFKNGQASGGTNPFWPANSSCAQVTIGCPGNMKTLSGAPTWYPGSHTSQTCEWTAVAKITAKRNKNRIAIAVDLREEWIVGWIEFVRQRRHLHRVSIWRSERILTTRSLFSNSIFRNEDPHNGTAPSLSLFL